MIIMRKTKKFPLSLGPFCGAVPGARETREVIGIVRMTVFRKILWSG